MQPLKQFYLFFSDTFQITKRNLIKYKRVPELIVFSSIEPVMFLLIMNYVFGGAIAGDGSYINFLLPGVILQSSVFGSMQTGVGLSEDMSKGIVDRFKTLPISRAAVLAGRTFADMIRNLFVLSLMLVVGLGLGFRPEFNVPALVSAALISLMIGYALSWVSAAIGISLKDPESAQVAGFIWVFPLVFISSVYVPVETMPASLEFVAKYSPVTISVDAIRELLLHANYTPEIWQSVVWSIGLVLIFGTIATFSYKRR